MSQFNRKGYTTIKANDGHGGVTVHPIHKNSKLARIAKHKQKQLARAQRERIRQYKQKLRDAKKQHPIEERSRIRLEDL